MKKGGIRSAVSLAVAVSLAASGCKDKKSNVPTSTSTSTTTTAIPTSQFLFTIPGTNAVISVTNDSTTVYSDDMVKQFLSALPPSHLMGISSLTASRLFQGVADNVYLHVLTEDERNGWVTLQKLGTDPYAQFQKAYLQWIQTWASITYTRDFYTDLMFGDHTIAAQWLYMAGVFADSENGIIQAYNPKIDPDSKVLQQLNAQDFYFSILSANSFRISGTRTVTGQVYIVAPDDHGRLGIVSLDNTSISPGLAIPLTFLNRATPGLKSTGASSTAARGTEQILQPSTGPNVYISTKSPADYISPLDPNVHQRLESEINDLRKRGYMSRYRQAPGAVPHGFVVPSTPGQ